MEVRRSIHLSWLHLIQPVDDGSQGQTIVADLAVVLCALATREQPCRDRARVREHACLGVPLFQRDVVVFASGQQQNVPRDGRGDIRRLELPEFLKKFKRLISTGHVQAFLKTPLHHQTFSGNSGEHPVHHTGRSEFQQGFQQSAQQRRGLAQSDIKAIRKNIEGNRAFDARLQGCGTHHQTSAHSMEQAGQAFLLFLPTICEISPRRQTALDGLDHFLASK